jgi:hypothetical protein
MTDGDSAAWAKAFHDAAAARDRLELELAEARAQVATGARAIVDEVKRAAEAQELIRRVMAMMDDERPASHWDDWEYDASAFLATRECPQ